MNTNKTNTKGESPAKLSERSRKASQKLPVCDHNEMVRDPVGKYGYWMCAKCHRPYGKPAQEEPSFAKATEGRHSPLPWTWNEMATIVATDDTPVASVLHRDWQRGPTIEESKANAQLIVASVNNAGKLAEALRDQLINDPKHFTPMMNTALAAWEAGQ